MRKYLKADRRRNEYNYNVRTKRPGTAFSVHTCANW